MITLDHDQVFSSLSCCLFLGGALSSTNIAYVFEADQSNVENHTVYGTVRKGAKDF